MPSTEHLAHDRKMDLLSRIRIMQDEEQTLEMQISAIRARIAELKEELAEAQEDLERARIKAAEEALDAKEREARGYVRE